MTISLTSLSDSQWVKVVKALLYSFFSGFVGGMILSVTNLITNGGSISQKAVLSLVIAAIVAGINTLAVGIKQVFTPDVADAIDAVIAKEEQVVAVPASTATVSVSVPTANPSPLFPPTVTVDPSAAIAVPASVPVAELSVSTTPSSEAPQP